MNEITDTEILTWLDENQARVERSLWCWTVAVPGWTEGQKTFERTGTTLRDAAKAAIVADRGYRAEAQQKGEA